MPNHPTLKTYEEFLENMAKEDQLIKRRYFELIQRSEREIARLRAKASKKYYSEKAKRQAAKEANESAE